MSFLDDLKAQFDRPNNALNQLIVINVVIYVVLVLLYLIATITGVEPIFALVYRQFSIPPVFGDFIYRPWTIISYAFAHSITDFFHILFNMLALYWFGRIIQDFLGSPKVINLYVLGALSGAVVYLLAFNTIPYYQERIGFPGMVGASGAVYAIAMAAATLAPNYQFNLLFFGPVRIKYIVGVYILISLVGSTGGNAGGNIAHLGGVLMGYVYIKQLQQGSDWGIWITSFIDWVKGLFQPSARIKVTHRKSTTSGTRTSSSAPKASSSDQAEIDRILDKISERGYEALSKEEKEKLFNASKR
ncbi:rhomboid family intramembrane serine protease [Cytophagales bacterium LB-30]|uniref:Rhomboid family intramembrane serine protease n=1 Tax=Shiella aurantiaca TaxID=3058365 RepID=A0ABT8F337_9BACT|nr:rhomboid family intramembrane serine protease [Shiella aurantiaca]MDN4164718.1 rhomboid family intramembrane serine protease [Shiella aurantiaca]